MTVTTTAGRRASGGWPLPNPTERAARGRAARARTPRSSHGEYAPASDRVDPIEILERQSATRVRELVPIRYGRMVESPFRFFRGAAAIMASDLSSRDVSGITAQLCGDAHLLNFRLLASPERQLVFDLNDFDETLPGPWEWDVERLATSLVVAGRDNGFTAAENSALATAAVGTYREFMRAFAGMTNLDVWYAQANVDPVHGRFFQELDKTGRRRAQKQVAKARTRTNLQAFERLTTVVDGERRIAADPPLLVPLADLLPEVARSTMVDVISELLDGYRSTLSSERRSLLGQYRLVDVARKVVGVGSVGTRCWVVLMLGRDEHDPLILQVKEAQTSALAAHLGPSEYGNQGQRVASGQRMMQSSSDVFLGWQRINGIDGRRRDFYVRQLRDWKGIAPVDQMGPRALTAFAQACGVTLARAHARSGDRIAISAYLGGGDAFDRAMARFAEAYADQNEADFAALKKAVSIGRLTTETTA